MLDVYVHPSSLDFVDVLGLKPPKEDHSPEFGNASFLFVIEVLVEPPPQIFGEAHIHYHTLEGRQHIATRLLRYETLSVPPKSIALGRGWHEFAEVHISMSAVMDSL
jgi:hypothetical protein